MQSPFAKFLTQTNVTSVVFGFLTTKDLNAIYQLSHASKNVFSIPMSLIYLHQVDIVMACPVHAFSTTGLMGCLMKAPNLHTVRLYDPTFSTPEEMKLSINRHLSCRIATSRSVGRTKCIIFDCAHSELLVSGSPIQNLSNVKELHIAEHTNLYAIEQFTALEKISCPPNQLPELLPCGWTWKLKEYHYVSEAANDGSFRGMLGTLRHDRFWRSLERCTDFSLLEHVSVPSTVNIIEILPQNTLRLMAKLSNLTSLTVAGSEQQTILGIYANGFSTLKKVDFDLGLQIVNIEIANSGKMFADNPLESLTLHTRISNNVALNILLPSLYNLRELTLEYRNNNDVLTELQLSDCKTLHTVCIIHQKAHLLIGSLPESLELLTLQVGDPQQEHMDRIVMIYEHLGKKHNIFLETYSIGLSLAV